MDDIQQAIHAQLKTMKLLGMEVDDEFVAKKLAEYIVALVPYIKDGTINIETTRRLSEEARVKMVKESDDRNRMIGTRLFGTAAGASLIFGMIGDYFGLCYLFAIFGVPFGLYIAWYNLKTEKAEKQKKTLTNEKPVVI